MNDQLNKEFESYSDEILELKKTIKDTKGVHKRELDKVTASLDMRKKDLRDSFIS